MSKENSNKTASAEASITSDLPTCGIVMPISEIDGLPPSHWSEVLQLLIGSAENAGFQSKLVSESNFSGVIQQRIIQNLYQNELVICDVSGQNPNVMFELGLRLAFDKATIVVVDDRTKISFDTSPIEHLIYPRDLRHGKMIDFTSRLTEMIKATHLESQKDGYSTFLKHFGTFEIKGLEKKEGGVDEYLLSAIQDMSSEINNLRSSFEKLQDSKPKRSGYLFPYSEMTNSQKLSDLILEAMTSLNLKISSSLDTNQAAIDIRKYIVSKHRIGYTHNVIQDKLDDYKDLLDDIELQS